MKNGRPPQKGAYALFSRINYVFCLSFLEKKKNTVSEVTSVQRHFCKHVRIQLKIKIEHIIHSRKPRQWNHSTIFFCWIVDLVLSNESPKFQDSQHGESLKDHIMLTKLQLILMLQQYSKLKINRGKFYLTRSGTIFWIFWRWTKHWLQHSLLKPIISAEYKVRLGTQTNMTNMDTNKQVLNLSSAWRSTPTVGGAETVANTTEPKTATSFSSISMERVVCLLIKQQKVSNIL